MTIRANRTLAVLACCFSLFPAAWAHGMRTGALLPQPAQVQQANPSTSQGEDKNKSQSTQSFVGTVMKSGDSYVLKTIDHGTYQLDDQARAQKFSGKVVQVMGYLDTHRNTIQVQDIKAGS